MVHDNYTEKGKKCATKVLVAWSSLETFPIINVYINTEIFVTHAKLQTHAIINLTFFKQPQ